MNKEQVSDSEFVITSSSEDHSSESSENDNLPIQSGDEQFLELDLEQIEADARIPIPSVAIPRIHVDETAKASVNSDESVVGPSKIKHKRKAAEEVAAVKKKFQKIENVYSELENIFFIKKRILQNTYLRLSDKKITQEKRNILQLKYDNALSSNGAIVGKTSVLKDELDGIRNNHRQVLATNSDIVAKYEKCSQIIESLENIARAREPSVQSKNKVEKDIIDILKELEDARTKQK